MTLGVLLLNPIESIHRDHVGGVIKDKDVQDLVDLLRVSQERHIPVYATVPKGNRAPGAEVVSDLRPFISSIYEDCGQGPFTDKHFQGLLRSSDLSTFLIGGAPFHEVFDVARNAQGEGYKAIISPGIIYPSSLDRYTSQLAQATRDGIAVHYDPFEVVQHGNDAFLVDKKGI
mgnify:CR=1 FL=1